MAKALSQYYNEETGRTAAIVKYGYGGTALAVNLGEMGILLAISRTRNQPKQQEELS